jgi:maltooligosyltrehalose trehalohydrolase
MQMMDRTSGQRHDSRAARDREAGTAGDVTAESWLGALPDADGTRFRVHAPAATRLAVVLEGGGEAGGHGEGEHAMHRDAEGYWTLRVPGVRPGALYRYRVDDQCLPDPCSRFQPKGVHGPSQVVDPNAYRWRDDGWTGIRIDRQVLYELHVGAFTPQGTFDAAITKLAALAQLGITTVEVMPIAAFPGQWNWGYDGVALFAPYAGYGDYEAFKRFVDAAHALGLGVILDVVYNHLGPSGSYIAAFNPHTFSERHATEWGDALDLDGPHAHALRDLFVRNAAYWVHDFHLDGLRLDATQSIFDDSPVHVVAEITAAARAAAAPRSIIVVAENEPQATHALAPAQEGGWGIDALWNDDFHHSALVALTGRRHAYYHDYRGHAQELVSATKYGFLYQGQYYAWQKQPRGEPVTDEPAPAFVTFLENHDQTANMPNGPRLATFAAAARVRAMTALLLLSPQTPMLFMGQEWGSTRPFLFFADHEPELAVKVHAGRRDFMAQFEACASAEGREQVADPAARATFDASKLDWAQRERNRAMLALHADLLALRRDDPVLARQARTDLDGAVLGEHAFLLRWFDAEQGDRLLLVNLGLDVDLATAPEPLLAPPPGRRWSHAWSSEASAYGGEGALWPLHEDGAWYLTGGTATLLRAASREDVALVDALPRHWR